MPTNDLAPISLPSIRPCRHAERCIAEPCEGYEQLKMIVQASRLEIAGLLYEIERLNCKVAELLAEKARA